MAFYYFGPDQSSWALGNDEFALANNLPESIQAVWDRLAEPFEDKQMAGTMIQWISTSRNGDYAIMTKNVLSGCDELHSTIAEQLQNVPGTCVEHISFSPLGGWYIKYTDGTAQLSGRFPDAFYAIANRYLDLTIQSRQTSYIDSILFGNENSIVVKAGSALHWDGISHALTKSLNSLTPEGIVTLSFTSGPNTVLCPWSDEFYFIEAIPVLPGATQYAYELPTTEVSTELLKHLESNTRPPEHLIPPVSRLHSPLPKTRQPPSSSGVSNPVPLAGDGRISLLPPSVPANMRTRYEQQFVMRSSGTDHVNGPEAARILLNTGLDSKVLFDIWELVDKDKTGTLDKEEFVQAMWQTDLRRTGTNVAIRWAEAPLSCDGCSRGFIIGEDSYFCTVCGGGDFDLCLACYADTSKRCQHDLSRVTIQLPSYVTPRFLPGNYALCDGCGVDLEDGAIVYCCSICNGGDYDICEACWEVRRTCSHLLSLYKLQAASTEITSPIAPDTHQPPSPFAQGAPENPPTQTQEPTGQPPSAMDQLSALLMNSSLEDSLPSSIVSEKPNVKWEEVVGLETAKAELREAIIPTRFPQLFRGNRQARRALLLYGPPGTGKSYLAQAVATEADLAFFRIRCSDVDSTRVGEGESLMRQLFTLAREKKPSVVFIDALDALRGKRDGEDANAEHAARMTTEFLVQMEAGNNDGVFVLAATNQPWSLYPAVQRRFQKRLHRCVHVPLPDEGARNELFKVRLGDMASSLGNGAEAAFHDLAQKTAGFSGRDISDLVQDALRAPVRKAHAATHFRKFRDEQGEWYTPCDPFEAGALPMKWDEVPARQLREPALTLADLHGAVSKAKPSVGEEDVRKCNEWTRRYAMEGA